MNVTFTSETYGNHEWSVKPEKMLSTEAEMIEGVTQKTFVEWGQALFNGSTICGRALVWVLLKRENPNLRFREVAYPVGALKIELDDDDKARLREELKRNDDLTDEEKRQILLSLGETELDALDFEPGHVEPDGPGNAEPADSAVENG